VDVRNISSYCRGLVASGYLTHSPTYRSDPLTEVIH
jgi:hypothetical protein